VQPSQPVPVAATQATVAPSAEMPLRPPERTAVAVPRSAPDRAGDPNEEPVVTETPLPEPTPAPADDRPPMRATAPISEVTPARAASFRVRTAKLARVAVSRAHQRRALLAALLGVAALSATVGALAGRWLAARAEAPAATR
jgi:hypothetical protein